MATTLVRLAPSAMTTARWTLSGIAGTSQIASTSQRLLSTSSVALAKSRPGEGKAGRRKARQAAILAAMPRMSDKPSKYASTEMTLSEAVRLFHAVEVSQPLNAFEMHVKTSTDRSEVNALRGRLQLPKDQRTRPEFILVLAEEASPVAKTVQGMMDSNESAKATMFLGGEEAINELALGRGAVGAFKYTKVLCTTSLLPALSRKMARNLGPRGLMPNVKRGTAIRTAAETVEAVETLQGSLDWRGDKDAVIHGAVGRVYFSEAELRANIAAFLHGILDKINAGLGKADKKVRPSAVPTGKMAPGAMQKAKRTFTQVHLTTTQGPSVLLNLEDIL